MSTVVPARSARADQISLWRKINWERPVFGVVLLTLLLLVSLPTAWLLVYSLTDEAGKLSFGNFGRFFRDPTLFGPFVLSIEIALESASLACLASIPLAWLVAKTDMPFRNAIRALVMAAFVTPPFLGAAAWELLAAPHSGLLNVFAREIFRLGPYDYLFNIYTAFGLAFTIACYTFPYVFILLANALERVPADLEHASLTSGATLFTTARRVTLPLVLPSLLAGALVAFLQSLTMFGAPAMLALPSGFNTLTTKLVTLFQYPPQTHLAAAAAFPLLLVTFVVLGLQRKVLGRRSFIVTGSKSGTPRRVTLGLWKGPALFAAGLLMTCPVILPYCALFKTAVTKNLSDPLRFDTMTLEHVRTALFEYSATQDAITNTLILGLSAASIVSVMAIIIAYVVTRRPGPVSQFWAAVAMLPLAVPGIVMGVGLFLVYSRPPFLLYGTLWILLIGFVTMEVPAGFQQIQAALRGLHRELEEAAFASGASRLQTLWRVDVPLMRATIVSTWCIVFIGVIRELSATILLTTSNTQVLSVVIFNLNETGDLGAISVLGLAILLVTFAIVLALNKLPAAAGQPRL